MSRYAVGQALPALVGARPESHMEESRKFKLNWPRWAGRFLKLYGRLMRVRVVNQPDVAAVSPVVFAHWHQEDLGLLPHFSFTKSTILVSPSKDGEALGRSVEAMGYRYVSGSSAKGALGGLLALKRVLEGGGNIIVAADGPRGPRLVAKPGALFLAAKTGRPIYPAGMAVDRAFVFGKSWNRTRLPLPFARIVVYFGPPLPIPPEGARWSPERQSRVLGAAIDDCVRHAEIMLEDWKNGL